ncbi:MAG: hypothetical protein SFZ02_05265 [bacterium]|nr:hypothetical protein [bacterium]
MKIPIDAIIAPAKLTHYLLVFHEQDDKSLFLAQAGFTLDNSDMLEKAIRQLITTQDAIWDVENEYGIFYLVEGLLQGVNERQLAVITVWMQVKATSQFRFITLKPARSKS